MHALFPRLIVSSTVLHTVAIIAILFTPQFPRVSNLDSIAITIVSEIPGKAAPPKSRAPRGPLPPPAKQIKPKIDPEATKPQPPKISDEGKLKDVPATADAKPQPSSNSNDEQRTEAKTPRKVVDVKRLLNTVEQLRSQIREKNAPNVAQINQPSDEPEAKILDNPVTDTATPEISAGAIAAKGRGASTGDYSQLKAQLTQCWNLPVATQAIADYQVIVELTIDPTAILLQAKIIDQNEHSSDPTYLALAESVIRAVWNPSCSPLALPLDFYHEWQTTIITFDPSWILQG